MSGEPTIVAEGNVGGDAEVRLTPNGDPVAGFSLAVTPRIKRGQEWVDGETLWFRVSAFGFRAEQAVNVARKGARVVVVGHLAKETWTDRDNQQRESLIIRAESVSQIVKAEKAQAEAPAQSDGGAPW